MAKFVSREKLSKKARKELDNQKRTVWVFSPTTKKVESKKLYNRRKSAHAWKNDFGMSAFVWYELFYDEPLRIERRHERLICRAGYRAGLADRVVADDIGEAGRVLVHGRRVYESLDGLYQRFTALAGYVEGRLHILRLVGCDGRILRV